MADPHPPKLLDRVRHACGVRRCSIRTEDAYTDWVRRFVRFHGSLHRADLGEPAVNAFQARLAADGRVTASTQIQALCGLLFLSVHALGRPPARPAPDGPGRLPQPLGRADGPSGFRLAASRQNRRDRFTRRTPRR